MRNVLLTLLVAFLLPLAAFAPIDGTVLSVDEVEDSTWYQENFPWEYVRHAPDNDPDHWWWLDPDERDPYSGRLVEDLKQFGAWQLDQAENHGEWQVIRQERPGGSIPYASHVALVSLMYPHPLEPPLMFQASILLVLEANTGDTSCSTTSWASACEEATDAESSVSRGDDIYIGTADTLDGVIWNVATNGTEEIGIYAATDASHGVATGWDSDYAVDGVNGPATFTGGGGCGPGANQCFDSAYWRFDGQVGGCPTTSNNLDSFFTGHGLLISHPPGNSGIQTHFGGTSGLYFGHIEIDGNNNGSSSSGDNFYIVQGPDEGTIECVYAHDPSRGNMQNGGGANEWTVFGSAFTVPGSNFGTHSEWVSFSNFAHDWLWDSMIFLDPISTGGLMWDGTGHTVVNSIFSFTSGGPADPTGCQDAGCSNGVIGHRTSLCDPDLCGPYLIVFNLLLDFQDAQAGDVVPTGDGPGTIMSSNIVCNVPNFSSASTSRDRNTWAEGSPVLGTNAEDLSSTDCVDLFTSHATVGVTSGSSDFSLQFETEAGDATYAAMFPVDMFGNSRVADGTPTRGPIEFDSGGSEPIILIFGDD